MYHSLISPLFAMFALFAKFFGLNTPLVFNRPPLPSVPRAPPQDPRGPSRRRPRGPAPPPSAPCQGPPVPAFGAFSPPRANIADHSTPQPHSQLTPTILFLNLLLSVRFRLAQLLDAVEPNRNWCIVVVTFYRIFMTS